MTYNIRHAAGSDGRVRPAAVAAELQRHAADIVALQEVDRLQWRSGLHDQARYFARALGMRYVYAPAITRGASGYGVALLSRFPLEAARSRLLAGGREPRCVLTAEVEVGGQRLTVATTHLGVAAADRAAELPQLLAALAPIATPLVLLGDFNSAANDPALGRLTAALGLRELAPDAPQPTVRRGGAADHIFTGLPAAAPAWIGQGGPSDHLPVLGALSLPGE